MIPASSGFKAALTASHRGHMRVTAWRRDVDNDRTYLADLPVESGTLVIDSGGDYWRTLDITVANETWNSDGDTLDELLNAADTDLIVEAGVDVDGTTEWETLATLRVDRVEKSNLAAKLAVTATDEGSRLNHYDILVPWPNADEPEALSPSRGMIATIQKFVNDTYNGDPPTWTVSDEAASRSSWAWRSTLTWQGNRWGQIKALCDALGVWVFNFPDGSWGMAKLPALDSTPVAYFLPGEYQVLEDASTDDDRDETYNVVYVRWETTDGGSDAVVARDDDPSSPTYYAGPCGQQVKVIDNDVVTNRSDAQEIADELLAQYIGLGTRLTVKAVWNPLLIPGDHVQVVGPDGVERQHIVNRIELPIPPGRMTLGTRLANPAAAS